LKKGIILTTIVISALMLSFIAFPLSVTAQAPDFIPGKTQIVSAFGKVPGQDLIVHVVVLVPQGSDKNEIANEAVRQQGARPIDHTEFSLTGLEWTQTDNAGNVIVTQRYNPSGDPTGGGLGALLDTHTTWTGVSYSNFAFVDGGPTTDCPSLVRECPGKQFSDGNNDVAWLSLKGKNTLGVTWFNTNTVEADMAMNTKFSWSTDNTGGIDVETVFLHENGHVVGLGHSDVTGAVMEAVYAGMRQSLHPDDVCGIQTLYGTPGPECTSEPTPDPTPGTPNSLDITHGSHNNPILKSGGDYSNRNTVHIFVKALDGPDGVAGVPIHVVVNAPKSTLSGDTTTDDNGVAHIHYKVKAGRDGTSEPYHISATANGGSLSCNHNDGACHADFTVK